MMKISKGLKVKNGRGFILQVSSRGDVVSEEKGQPWVAV